MNIDLNRSNLVTAVFLIVALAGAVVTIVHPNSLDFGQYVRDVLLGGGLLGIGRGIASHGRPDSS